MPIRVKEAKLDKINLEKGLGFLIGQERATWSIEMSSGLMYARDFTKWFKN